MKETRLVLATVGNRQNEQIYVDKPFLQEAMSRSNVIVAKA